MGAMSFCIAGISLAAGVGGGGLFVPLLMVVLETQLAATNLKTISSKKFTNTIGFDQLSHRHGCPARPYGPLTKRRLERNNQYNLKLRYLRGGPEIPDEATHVSKMVLVLISQIT